MGVTSVAPSGHLLMCADFRALPPLFHFPSLTACWISDSFLCFFCFIFTLSKLAESEEELKSLLMKVKEESEKAGLKLNIQKMNIMASGPITSWEIDGETVETVLDFIPLGSKITAGGDCSHEIKRHLLLGRKVNDQPR